MSNITIKPPKKPKLITGTKFATVLGLNSWQTPFETWCDIVKLGNTFEPNKYTEAGKAIEPIVIDYLKEVYGYRITTPEDEFGENPYKKTWGNFFDESAKPFGGMWDAILVNEFDVPQAVIEIKTTSRHQDWLDGSPEYYALQGALYAYLMGLDDVLMVVALLERGDYDRPQNFKCDGGNVLVEEFKVSERFPDFEEKLEQAKIWYEHHVLTGISPEYDPVKDSEILQEIKTDYIDPDAQIETLLREAERLKAELDENKQQIKNIKSQYKSVTDLIKERFNDRIGDNERLVVQGDNLTWTYKRYKREKVDKKKLRKDGLEKYIEVNEYFRLTNKEAK
ncbi:MAG: YqaJ viral recombinase family protein [archaeon]